MKFATPVASPVQPPEVYITSGSQQSLDIVARTLLDPGDTIVVERPTYLAALQVFQLAQANILSVDTDDDGMLVEQLADLLETTRVKAVYLGCRRSAIPAAKR